MAEALKARLWSGEQMHDAIAALWRVDHTTALLLNPGVIASPN
ncbi:hypothetical protein ACVMAJ_005125 [Bradyrhizobium sp. USDA 4448]